MRVLHTADWHLGRPFHGESLLDAQAAVVDHVVEVARTSCVDAVLLAGDLFDRALPPVDAVRLADEALRRLVEVCPVVLISGNHDSGPRLGFGSGLLEGAGLHVRTDPARVREPIAVGDGLVYALPYLEPDVARDVVGAEGRGHGPVLRAAMDHVRADLAARAFDGPSIALAHAFVAGALESASERDLAVGGAASVPLSTFEGASYVALGHLHAPQRVGSTGRYAGSPVAFSFSEAGQTKSLAVVDVRAGAAPEVELLACPVLRPLATIRGTLDELLTDAALDVHEGAWVQATLTDPARPADAMERLRRRFPHAVVLAFDPQGALDAPGGSYAARLRGLDDAELVARFVQDVRGVEASEAELALLGDALTAGRVAEVAA
ncbi:exonuclease SbcCD subunit D [Conexibacter sp. SYSU D00693]|uniref:exonuclease SbcCD subunit D n=1 Tax=Conexibacter sp. SYSU D00693 TaxID=2812560 RepID=UPI00196B2898|nr:exonuclease SbcCD subunit D [Conexibacter sp. SYSU D00693]